MIRINLLPVKQAAQAERQRQGGSRPRGLLLVLLVSLFLLQRMKQGHDLAAAEAQIAQVEDEVKALDVQVKDVRDLEGEQKALDAKFKVIANLGQEARRAGRGDERPRQGHSGAALSAATITGTGGRPNESRSSSQPVGVSVLHQRRSGRRATQDQVGENKLRKFIVKVQINYATGDVKKAERVGVEKPAA